MKNYLVTLKISVYHRDPASAIAQALTKINALRSQIEGAWRDQPGRRVETLMAGGIEVRCDPVENEESGTSIPAEPSEPPPVSGAAAAPPAAEVPDMTISGTPPPALLCRCGHSEQLHYEDGCSLSRGCHCGLYTPALGAPPAPAEDVTKDALREELLEAKLKDPANHSPFCPAIMWGLPCQCNARNRLTDRGGAVGPKPLEAPPASPLEAPPASPLEDYTEVAPSRRPRPLEAHGHGANCSALWLGRCDCGVAELSESARHSQSCEWRFGHPCTCGATPATRDDRLAALLQTACTTLESIYLRLDRVIDGLRALRR